MNRQDSRSKIGDALRVFRFHSLFIRNFVVSVALILIPLAGLNVLLIGISKRLVVDEATLLSGNALEATREMFDSVFRRADYLAASISLENQTEVFALARNPEEILGRGVVEAISARLRAAVYSDSYLHSIYIYSAVSDRVITHVGQSERKSLPDSGWYEAYLEIDENRIHRGFRRINGIYPYVITLIKPLFLFGGASNYGAVVVNIDIDYLERVLLGADVNTPEELYVIGDDGIVMFATRTGLLGGDSREVELASLPGHIVSITESERYGWRFVSRHDLESYVLKTSRLERLVIAILIVSLFATVAAAFLISRNSYLPIRKILGAMHGPERIDRHVSGNEDTGNEAKYIATAIARFAHTNNELRDELGRQLTELDRARSEALQVQINPHFLNNTLQSISLSARRLTEGENQVTRMISLLSRLLSISLDTSENIVRLSEEIEHAKLYLEILEHRYADRFTVEWRIPDELASFGVLKLSIQPLIENAFYHGIKPARTRGEIGIAARIEANDLHIEVSNTGRGFPVQSPETITATHEADFRLSPKHIGMRNVDQRIKLIFGNAYGLDIERRGERLTAVSIRIPAIDASGFGASIAPSEPEFGRRQTTAPDHRRSRSC